MEEKTPRKLSAETPAEKHVRVKIDLGKTVDDNRFARGFIRNLKTVKRAFAGKQYSCAYIPFARISSAVVDVVVVAAAGAAADPSIRENILQ
ncbi:Hypothetical protein CINCED_3A006709 [Cinara cedri]|uniref:Uncharacterized protein n=1 Tax=Cinara cedri TaxID=506608 RepID=A0A5E4NR15_9HEMI|nr:Hypothetical protein CINCED_3A006709 [Cinara cedri]